MPTFVEEQSDLRFHQLVFSRGQSRPDQSDSNRLRVTRDCRMMESNVPVRISA
jgi:hypothetical protein